MIFYKDIVSYVDALVLETWKPSWQSALSASQSTSYYNLFTLYWQEEFDWLEINHGSNTTEHRMMMKHNSKEYKYGVGVSYNSFRSGVLWANCLYGSAAPGKHGKCYFRVSVFIISL